MASKAYPRLLLPPRQSFYVGAQAVLEILDPDLLDRAHRNIVATGSYLIKLIHFGDRVRILAALVSYPFRPATFSLAAWTSGCWNPSSSAIRRARWFSASVRTPSE